MPSSNNFLIENKSQENKPPTPPTLPTPDEDKPPKTNTTSEETSDNISDISSECDMPVCDNTPVEIKKCKPTIIPITMELSPVVNVLVNKPKICLKNKAVCKPCFFLKE
jgi:hypothetical protein